LTVTVLRGGVGEIAFARKLLLLVFLARHRRLSHFLL
jgi:hypothetical protein